MIFFLFTLRYVLNRSVMEIVQAFARPHDEGGRPKELRALPPQRQHPRLYGVLVGLSVALALAISLGVSAGAGRAAGSAAPQPHAEPGITGASAEGNVLTASKGSWKSDSAIDYSYQWRRCASDGTGCLDIPAATDRIYTSRTADVGHTLRVVVTATNKHGSNVATSNATAVVVAASPDAPRNAALPTISGSPMVGQTLTAAPGTLDRRKSHFVRLPLAPL